MKIWLLLFTISIFQLSVLIACSNPTEINKNKNLENPGLDLPSASLESKTVNIESPDVIPEDLLGVWETFNLLMREYVDRKDLDPEQLEKAAITGMLNAIEDPYTSYIDPSSFELAMSDTQGSFEGIGAEVTMTPDGKLMIVAPIPDTPAEKAGIRPGDVILKVDGESIEGFSLLESVMKIRGPRGSIVKLEIQHLFEENTALIEITRGTIQISSVNMNITDEDFAYINLSVFYENTTEELSNVLEKAIKQDVKGIILDLRNGSVNMIRSLSNGGGLYITFARWYTPSGRLIEGEGLSPDILIEQSQNQREDAQFEKALEILSEIISSDSK